MKVMRYFFLLVISILPLLAHAKGTTFYRHIPFNIELAPDDKIIVDYDFSEKKGIYCSASHQSFLIDFIYKGHSKSAHLPIKLISDHVPNHPNEELADLKGQFTLSMDNSIERDPESDEIYCTYGDTEEE